MLAQIGMLWCFSEQSILHSITVTLSLPRRQLACSYLYSWAAVAGICDSARLTSPPIGPNAAQFETLCGIEPTFRRALPSAKRVTSLAGHEPDPRVRSARDRVQHLIVRDEIVGDVVVHERGESKLHIAILESASAGRYVIVRKVDDPG